MPSKLKRSFSSDRMTVKKAKRSGRPTTAMKLNRLLKGIELKEYNTVGSGTVTTSGSVLTLNPIAEGTDYNSRIGRHISTAQIQVDFSVENGAQTFDTGFVALVYDAQPNGTAAGYSAIFDTTSALAGQAFKATYQFKDRFKIAWIEHFAISSAGPECVKVRKYYKAKEGETDVEYYASGSSIPNTGAWYLCYGDCGTDSNTVILYNVKYQFTDM